MNSSQRSELVRIIEQGEEISPEWARILFPPEKREYELVYHGKEREEEVLSETLSVPLQKVRSFGKTSAGWHNQLIFGDNLQVMKQLMELKRSGSLSNADGTPGVRLVYIDPPFATRREFRGTADQRAYQDKIAGAQFIEFLRKRLILIRELLSDDGSVFIHLDYKKSHYIKTICDEVFGEANFRSEIVWKRTDAHNDTKGIGKIHDTILHFSKSSAMVWNPIYIPLSTKTADKWYRHVDEETGRRYNKADLTARGLRRGETGKPWRGINPGEKGNHWRYPPSRLDELESEGLIVFSGTGMPYLKRFLDDSKGTTLQDIWTDVPMIRGFGNQSIEYPTQKPEALLDRIIRSASNEGDLVLDAFAGSGTTPAVAEKLRRRWIAIDCGKLAVYTMQKRLLNLRAEIGNKGAALKPKPFDLFNAGLYDFSTLRKLDWDAWRFFALQLFQCRDEKHRVGGVELDGYLKGSSVMVFNYQRQPGVRIDEQTIESLHEAVGTKVGSRMFLIAPALVFDFQQDYLTIDGVRYYALRIPYSIIHEIHQRDFVGLRQPVDEMEVNATVDAVGFDFVRRPEVSYEVGVSRPRGELFDEAHIKINAFASDATVRDKSRPADKRETLSMVLLDYNFDSKADVFDCDAVFYAEGIAKDDWHVRFPVEGLGEKAMAVFLDIYGNEAREVLSKTDFSKPSKPKSSRSKKTARKR